MGNYNQDAPIILGEEWVPIFDTPDFQMIPTGNLLEQGHSFVLPAPRPLSEGRFYFKDLPPGQMYGQAYQVSLYPRGQEGLSGPIQRVMVPCNSAVVTGSPPPQVMGQPGGTVGSTAAQALLTPNDLGYIVFTDSPQPTTQRIRCSFAITPVLPQILNKRILGVNLVYMIGGQVAEYLAKTNIRVFLTINNSSQDYGTIQGEEGFILSMTGMQFHRTHFGELDNNSRSGLSDIAPWVTASLAHFEAGTVTNPYTVDFLSDITASNPSTAFDQVAVFYAALEIIYCEETRAAYGQVYYSDLRFPVLSMSANNATMKAVNTLTTPLVVPAGTYTAMLSSPDMGDYTSNTVPAKSGAVPNLRAPRQLYQLSSHVGVRTLIPFPVENHIGDVFATTTTDVLPQMSLHTTGGAAPWPEVHVYGQQIAAQVWGTITAVQGIDGSNGSSAASYPQARFWARRFGATTVPLQLASGASTASITPTVFDLLPEIMSGWKEVDLRFPVAPTMGTASGTTAWTFSAAGELPGNRWEVLGAGAYAVSGSPGNLLTPYPTGALDPATYLQPAGATARLSWLSPQVSGTTADSLADAALYFSQDPPTVTGLVISQLSQAVTGVNLDCTSPPLSIPTGITYQRIQWTSTAATGSGFGYYELQRQDTIDATWRTIMKTTSLAITGFNDYEARIGVQSSYQIRVANALGFVGSWSATGTGTIAAPGVTGRNVSNGVLVLSSNYTQSGIDNLAYMESWDGTPVEDLTFPEAGRNKLSWMYGKDDMSAFRPTERGGEQFNRALLVQNFAGTYSRLHNAFRSLRDVAWAQLPYVCVRNEIGDRWFMNIVVPSGSLRRNRAIQLVQAQFTEITGTPYPVDPAL